MADRPRRPLLLTALAVLLATESVAAVAVHAATPDAVVVPSAVGRPAATVADDRTAPRLDAVARALFAEPEDDPADDVRPRARVVTPRATSAAAASVAAASTRVVSKPGDAVAARTSAVVRAERASAGGSGSSRPQASGTGRYVGRNHVWIPSLGISRSVAAFPCSRTTPPGHAIYRWGCAGRNNVYLLGHASSVFKPLHDAYVRGRLRVGMQVKYADASGTVRTYAVRSWRVMAPDGDVAWAIAAQSRPSMTIQTCVGSRSERRLVVRLVQVG